MKVELELGRPAKELLNKIDSEHAEFLTDLADKLKRQAVDELMLRGLRDIKPEMTAGLAIVCANMFGLHCVDLYNKNGKASGELAEGIAGTAAFIMADTAMCVLTDKEPGEPYEGPSKATAEAFSDICQAVIKDMPTGDLLKMAASMAADGIKCVKNGEHEKADAIGRGGRRVLDELERRQR